jgi:putative glutathione S-transferase
MGKLIDGTWHDRWYNTAKTGGHFVRKPSQFRDTTLIPESGRYHLYVAWACPWAHRTLLFRALKGLTEHISVSFVDALMLDQGWVFPEPEPLHGATRLHELYTRSDASYTGRVTVPLLWDTVEDRAVNNESSEIIRLFNSAFDGLTGDPHDFWPEDQRDAIEAVNARVYDTLNNGVYRCGFATTQVAYDQAVAQLFDTLDWLEGVLAEQPFVAGDRLTEADWRLWATLLRFDAVYVTHFKCDRRRLVDHPNLWAYARMLAQVPGVRSTWNMDETRRHYFMSHTSINPHAIVSTGPQLDWTAPHGRHPDPLSTARR